MHPCKACGNDIPNRMVIGGKTRILSNRNRCLTCQPFKSGRKPLLPAKVPEDRVCKLCPNMTGGYAKLCGSCTQKVHRYRAKLAGIQMLGGKCVECGWIGKPAGFQFHHPEDDKEFNISSSLNRKWTLVQNEIRKCTLLCATCHAIEHSSQDNVVFLQEVASYRGRGLEFSLDLATVLSVGLSSIG